jgi:hypothetical protein
MSPNSHWFGSGLGQLLSTLNRGTSAACTAPIKSHMLSQLLDNQRYIFILIIIDVLPRRVARPLRLHATLSSLGRCSKTLSPDLAVVFGNAVHDVQSTGAIDGPGIDQ